MPWRTKSANGEYSDSASDDSIISSSKICSTLTQFEIELVLTVTMVNGAHTLYGC